MLITNIIMTKHPIKKISYILFVFSLILISCSKENLDQPIKRLVLVYMVADNDLDYFAIQNINEMEKGLMSCSNSDLYVYIDRSSNANPSHPYLMKIKPDTTDRVISEIVRTYPEQNSADAQVLKKVINDTKDISNISFNSLGLILWSHGSAWLPSGVSINSNRGNIIDSTKTLSRLKSFSIDTKLNNSSTDTAEMDIKELGKALNGFNFDFIIFDACFMSSIEVAYELRNSTKYLIASPTEILSSGYPYRKITPLLFDESFRPKEVANTFCDSYLEQKGVLKSASIAVINTNKLDALASLVYQINSKYKNKKMVSTDSIQQFDRQKVYLLFDLKQTLSFQLDMLSDNSLKESFNNVWSECIMCEYHTNNILGTLKLANCNGISTFIPTKRQINLFNYYKTLSWYKASSYETLFSNY